ncbi:MAG: RyR domain-containing protein, partial [Fimbriimonadaceae bacterium]
SPPDTLRFERFVFDPAHLEQTWSAGFDGTTFGTASLVTALLAVDECLEQKPSSHITVSRGLAAARRLHQHGAGGTKDEFMPRGTNAESVERKALAAAADDRSEKKFRSAFDRDLLDPPVLVAPSSVPPPEKQTLLTDAVGMTPEFLTVAAAEIVRFGKGTLKPSVPHMEWGDYFTVDRSEIESLNTVRNLILDYRQNAADKRPLSIAVFGQPGSGKSFAIKQLAGALFGKDKAVLEFNLSQFEDIDALHEAFHEVRDKSVQGQLPLVFWDEFDSPLKSDDLGWLKEFLAPMQDAKFFARGREHPFGKCIFIFAGGTCTTFDAFAQSVSGNEPDTKSAKGPDFVSRLRGYVNIKGPNPIAISDGDLDHAHIVRRALLLRSLIERHHKGIIQHDNDELVMNPSVLAAFLTTREYKHGARSMEAIVSLSHLRDSRHFGPSELPPREVVLPHVSEDFLSLLEVSGRIYFSPPQIDEMAAIMHKNWVTQKTASGWSKRHKPGRDSKSKTDSRLVAYESLPENEKEANRLPARLTLLRLDKLGYEVRRADGIEPSVAIDLRTQTDARHLIAQTEHRRWMREKLLAGAALAPCIDDDLLLHEDLIRFDKLHGSKAKLDYGIAEAIAQFFDEQGLVLVKKVQEPTGASGQGAA